MKYLLNLSLKWFYRNEPKHVDVKYDLKYF